MAPPFFRLKFFFIASERLEVGFQSQQSSATINAQLPNRFGPPTTTNSARSALFKSTEKQTVQVLSAAVSGTPGI
jgi:hypothetical protein